jgi:hypothetical protein
LSIICQMLSNTFNCSWYFYHNSDIKRI